MLSYLAEVHYPIILLLGTLMQDYSASLLLYKDGYYNIDDASKAKLPEQNFRAFLVERRRSCQDDPVPLVNKATDPTLFHMDTSIVQLINPWFSLTPRAPRKESTPVDGEAHVHASSKLTLPVKLHLKMTF